METNKIKKSYVWTALFLIVIPLGIYFWFGLQHLTQFETADEHLWISDPYAGRIQQYWNAFAQKDWKSTDINDKPGVTLALISGIGMRWENNAKDKIAVKGPQWTNYNPQKTQETYRLYRLPIVITNGIMGLFFFLALWRLTKKHWLALASAGLIMASPVLIGISQIINPDSFLWTFSFASVLSFMLFLQDKRWWAILIDWFLATIFLGLALLSKYVALVFFPFLLLMLLWHLFYNRNELVEEKVFRKKAIIGTIGFPLAIAGAIGLFALLMPAALVDKQTLYRFIFRFGQMQDVLIVCGAIDAFVLLDAVILKSWIIKYLARQLWFLRILLPKLLYVGMAAWFVLVLANWGSGSNFMHISLFDPSDGAAKIFQALSINQQFILEAKVLLFSLTPAVLLLLIFLFIKSIFKKSEFEWIIFLLTSFFIVFYYAVIKQGLLVNIRYSIVLYPIAAALAGIGFYELTKNLKNRYILPLFLILFGAGVISIRGIQPFYFNYTNDLLPKSLSIANAWGYGGEEALQYIKSQGGADRIYSDYYGVCPFFSGQCVVEGQSKWLEDKGINKIDYVIVSEDGSRKNKSGINAVSKFIPLDKPVWELDIDGRPDNFIKVYKNEQSQ